MTCKHDNVVFVGMYSLVGNYVCKDCNIEIDPVEYAKMKGHLNYKRAHSSLCRVPISVVLQGCRSTNAMPTFRKGSSCCACM